MNEQQQQLFELLSRCALREQQALRALYDKVGGYLRGIAIRIVKNEECANEVVQEAFIQIWENASTYRPHLASPLTWMVSILRYRALDRLTEIRKQQRVECSDELAEHEDAMTPEISMATTQHNRHIVKCMEGLNDTMRQSIQLAYLEGYSRDEIAQKLNTNSNTVKSWLRRAAERLKQCLELHMVSAT